jgi:hypothetical protein
MAKCKGCGTDTIDSWYGDWCDPCGGVMTRPDMLFFRHVATVDGPGGRLAIVWDVSTSDYALAYPRKVKASEIVREIDLNEFRAAPTCVAHGSLDAVLAIAHSQARGDSPDAPELSAAPSSTLAERSLIGL